MGDPVERWSGLRRATRAALLTLLTMLIAWIVMLLIAGLVYGSGSHGHWILLPMLLGLIELIAAPLAIALALVLRYVGTSTTAGPLFCHSLLILVFVLFGSGVLGNDNDLGEGALMPIGVHAVLALSIAWIGGAPSTSEDR